IDGDDAGAPESPAELAALGIDAAERTQLAQLYNVGDEFWRGPALHFSEVDPHTPYRRPPGAQAPPPSDGPEDDLPCDGSGSIVGCQDQVVRERERVNGPPFSLYYASDRVPGRTEDKQIDVRVTDSSLPQQLLGISVQAAVGGRLFQKVWVP